MDGPAVAGDWDKASATAEMGMRLGYQIWGNRWRTELDIQSVLVAVVVVAFTPCILIPFITHPFVSTLCPCTLPPSKIKFKIKEKKKEEKRIKKISV